MPLISQEKVRHQVYLCTRCGYCRYMVRARDGTERVCPLLDTTSGFELFTSRGRNWVTRQILEGKLDLKSMSNEAISAIYACFTCGSCTAHCLVLDPESWSRFPDNLYKDHRIFNEETVRFLRSLVVEAGIPPLEIREILQNYQRYGNPYGKPREERSAWTRVLDFKVKNITEERGETLLYVGSIASYDERNHKAVAAIAKILNHADIDFGILGNYEEDSGAEIYDLGEIGLLEEFAERNLEIFRKYGISKIITVSPHDYNIFVNYYPEILGEAWDKLNITVQHYTQVLADLFRNNKLTVKKMLERKVSYHDPCYLGRKNDIYDAPREILRAIGVKLIELRLSRHNSYCCGGGGGGRWYRPRERTHAEVERIKQAAETGADILVTACPLCLQMLEDGVKAVGSGIRIMDIAELVAEAIV